MNEEKITIKARNTSEGFIMSFTKKEPAMEERVIKILMKQEEITRERAKEITGYEGIDGKDPQGQIGKRINKALQEFRGRKK